MLRLAKAAIALLLVPLMTTGCWDIKHVQDINYVAAIGVEYAEGKYDVYVQMLDFSSVAKMETGKPTAPVPVWIGKGSGDSPIHALDDLYQSSQLRIFYGQVNAVGTNDTANGADGGAYKVNGSIVIDNQKNATFATLTCTGSPCGSGGGAWTLPGALVVRSVCDSGT